MRLPNNGDEVTTFKAYYYKEDALEDVDDDYPSISAITRQARSRLKLNPSYTHAIIARETQVYELTSATKTVTTFSTRNL
jgi:hypothetical protein